MGPRLSDGAGDDVVGGRAALLLIQVEEVVVGFLRQHDEDIK